MHIIRDKSSGNIIYVDYTYTDTMLAGEQIYAEFDGSQMELAWSEQNYIPAYFDIDNKGNIVALSEAESVNRGLLQLEPEQKLENGEIVDKSQSELIDEGLLKLEDIKQELIKFYHSLSFAKRAALIPDYKLNNAALGVYDDKRIEDYKLTIQAFRDEAKRLTGLVRKADTVEDLEAIKEKFPASIISVD